MPEPTAVAPPPAAEPAKAPEPAGQVETLSQTPAAQPTEKEQRQAARIANAKRQFERLNGERAKFQEEQNNWKAVSAQALRDAGALQQLRKLASEDPVKALEAMGHKFEDVLKKTANRGALTQETVDAMVKEKVSAELNKFKADLDEMNRVRAIKDAESTRDGQIRASKQQLADLAKDNPDKYEFVGATQESIDAAWDLIVETYAQTMDQKTNLGGVKLSLEEALDTLEEAYLNAHLARNESSKKVKAALEAKAAKAKEEADKAAKEASAKAAPANKWQRRTEPVAKQAPLTAASQAPNQPTVESPVQTRRPNINETIQRRLAAFRAARASNDA